MSKDVLNQLIDKQDLTRDEAEALMRSIMAGEVGDAQAGAILTALCMKGETVDEIAGFVSVMRDNVVGVTPNRNGLVDTCGTGGDSRHTFNISTTSALVAAALDIPIAKHGNRAVSSKCGSTDVLDALGININLSPEQVAALIDEVGIGFMFAPAHHPATRHVAPVRTALGVRTVFNLLGPMTNPAGVKRQLIGVFRRDLTNTVAKVLQTLGSEKVFVVHGHDGMDEVSLTAETTVSLLDNGRVHNMTFAPEDAGIDRATLADLAGGDAMENAAIVEAILNGEAGPKRDAVVLNTAFVAVVADKADNLVDGVALARGAIDSGKALAILNELRKASNELAA